MTTTGGFASLLRDIKTANEDFEWYPTTKSMALIVARHLPADAKSLLDIGAGDGRVLSWLAERCEHAELYAIEKSAVLRASWPERIVPVGTEFFEQNLVALPVDYIYSNCPYSAYEAWTTTIIASGHARRAYLVIPRRWQDSPLIAAALKARGATARIVHSADFLDADRRSRAIVDIVEVGYPMRDASYGSRDLSNFEDPFDTWFEAHIAGAAAFSDDAEAADRERDRTDYEREQSALAKIRHLSTIEDLVAAYDEEYARMEGNYRSIFKLDYELLRELGVAKDNIRNGIKLKMSGLKAKYWTILFERLGAITDRLSTATKAKFRERLIGRVTLAFTADNAYAVAVWSIRNANQYFDEQLVQLYRDISTFEGVEKYKSNVKTWGKGDWRWFRRDEVDKRPTHYSLDYRIVIERSHAIGSGYYYPHGLSNSGHELIADVVAVLFNLGFPSASPGSMEREWFGGKWQNWYRMGDRTEILFQAKAFMNGNLHLRFLPAAIKQLNVSAGRLLGWLRAPEDVTVELGYPPEEAAALYGHSSAILPGSAARLMLSAGNDGDESGSQD